MTEPTDAEVQPWNILAPPVTTLPHAPDPDETWRLRGGSAWVYYAPGHESVVKPVIFSDGFNSGPSDRDMIWDGMEREAFPFISRLHERGSDLIILGYDERSASILKNAEVAIECIRRAAGAPHREADLAVGGFSMGGLITRYALAKMEEEQPPGHHTAVYFSYDSPHRGAWIPISLQALAHYLRRVAPGMSGQINSPAARELLWRHIAEVDEEPEQDPMRTEFLAELDRVGGWPSGPVKLGVANGSGRGIGPDIPPGEKALECTGALHPYKTTTLYTQASGNDKLVARLKGFLAAEPTLVHTSLPELDGAPGGMLESFGIACDELAKYGATSSAHRWVGFVPSVSAVAIRDLDTQDDLYADISALPPEDSELDEFL